MNLLLTIILGVFILNMATHLFIQENSEIFPNAHKSLYKNLTDPRESANGWDRYCRWHNAGMNLESDPEIAGPFWPYLATTKVNVCPSFEKLAKKDDLIVVAGSTYLIGGLFESFN